MKRIEALPLLENAPLALLENAPLGLNEYYIGNQIEGYGRLDGNLSRRFNV
jgi:hypothetical protein